MILHAYSMPDEIPSWVHICICNGFWIKLPSNLGVMSASLMVLTSLDSFDLVVMINSEATKGTTIVVVLGPLSYFILLH